MIVRGYGIELRRLRHDDIEMVRNWRNAEHVSRYMEFREHITAEMQEAWFRSVDTIEHNYFIIHSGNDSIGLIYGSQIDWEKNETGNGGIFIWNVNYQKTLVPLRASLLLTDLSFLLGFERTYIKVLKDNASAISYNKSLGYELLPGQENVYNQRYVLEKESYFEKTRQLKLTLQKTSSPNISVVITDPGHPASKKMIGRYQSLTEENKKLLSFTIL